MTFERPRGTRQRLVALAGLIVIVGVLLAALLAAGVLGNQGGGNGIENVVILDPPRTPGQDALEVGVQVGELAPDFELSDFAGARHRLSDFRGKVVYVNLWATWCGPCRAELPDMQELLERHADQLAIIAVNRREPLERARAFFRDLPRNDGGTGISFTVDGMDPDDTLFSEFRGLGMPVSVIINPQGVVSRIYMGAIRLDTMEAAFAEALAGGSS